MTDPLSKEWSNIAKDALRESLRIDANGAPDEPLDVAEWNDTTAVKLFALREFDTLANPQKILQQLKNLAGNSGARNFAEVDEPSDPASILLELIALTQTSLAFHVSTEIAGLLSALLKLAGHSKIPAQPAVTIIAVAAKPGTVISAAERIIPPASCPLDEQDRPEDLPFVPAWPFTCWALKPAPEELQWDGRRITLTWRGALPSDPDRRDFKGPRMWAWFKFPGDERAVGERDRCRVARALQLGQWHWSWGAGQKSRIDVTGLPTPLFPGQESRFPVSWLTTAKFAPYQWLCFDFTEVPVSPNAPSEGVPSTDVPSVAPKHNDQESKVANIWEEKITEFAKGAAIPGILVCVIEDAPEDLRKLLTGTDNGEPPMLYCNHVPWVNSSPEQAGPASNETESEPVSPEPVLPDFFGLQFLPRHASKGKRANGLEAPPNELQWQRVGDHDDEAIFYSMEPTEGGKDEEESLDFIRRAPSVLRHRGIPCTAADWEELVKGCDPLGRIAACSVREGFFPFGYPPAWGKGVQVAYHCYGRAAEAQRLAHQLLPEIERVLELVRPLGTGIAVLCPVLISGKLSFWPDIARDHIDDKTKTELKQIVWRQVCLDHERHCPATTARRNGQADFQVWQRFRHAFARVVDRPRTAAHLLEESITAFFRQSKQLVTLGPFSFSFLPDFVETDRFRDWEIPWVATVDHIEFKEAKS
jgi:hypothetical protein